MNQSVRNPRVTFKERSIEKIKNGRLLDNLMKFCNNQLELSAKQVDCHLKLINKVLPDLQSQQVQVDVNHNVLNIHELNAKLVSLGQQPESVWSQLTGNPAAIEHESDDPEVIESEEETNSDAPGRPK